MRFEIDLTKQAYKSDVQAGERVVGVYLVNEDGSEELLNRNDSSMEIILASNNFILAGGDGYTMFAELEKVAQGNVLDEILADYITELTEEGGGSFTYEMEGNRSVEVNKK
jgi:2',3'-cyclic-nucleotide 2'-phosphodiesterase (5'-nucleotidase family)